MRSVLEKQIEISITKILNLKKQCREIENKLGRLTSQLEGINSSIENETRNIVLLGSKTSRRDGKPETPEELTKKEHYNQELLQQKLDLFKRNYPEIYQEFEDCVPTILKEENLMNSF